ncbi:MAG: phospholipid scramblase-related protein [Acidobacteriota bacterium]
MSEAAFRDAVRELKRLLRDDPSVLARYDVDGDGEISGEEWEMAVAQLRREMTASSAGPAAAGRAAYERMREQEPVAAGLATCRSVVVKQLVEMREVVVGYEQANRYVILDSVTGRELGGADESSSGTGGFLVRQFLGSGRPVDVNVTDQEAGWAAEATRPFSILGDFSPPELLALSTDGQPVGTVRRKWPIFIKRRYRITVGDKPGGDMMIDGSILSPWTFPVFRGGRQVALIKKKWSGGGRELLTDADTFHVSFDDPRLSVTDKRMLVIATLVIDFDYFERS